MDEENNEELMEENELSYNTQPSTPLEPNEADLTVNPPKSGDLLGVASKKLIQFLLKKKIIILSVVGAIILLFVIIFAACSNSSGVNDYQYAKDLDGKCSTVKVTYKPYDESQSSSSKSMNLEDYVKAAVAAYTKDIPEPSKLTHLYRALAIALRNEALTSNCEVIYRDKQINALNASSEEGKAITTALSTLENVVATRKNSDELLSVRVSDFCYKTNDGTNYTIYQVPDFTIPTSWVSANVPDIYKNCPCNQPNENLPNCYVTYTDNSVVADDFIGPIKPGETKKNWLHQDDTTGFNVYAAYYIFKTYGLNYENLLSYFIGDFDYRITKDPNDESESKSSSSSSQLCDMDLFSTSLSRSEFINGLRNYTGPRTNLVGFKKFQDNADILYDVLTQNGINPEFAVTRAVSEGFSPSVDDKVDYNTNNYWGVGCGNVNRRCVDYGPDFSQALIKFADYLKSTYTDMNDVISRYGYIGKYWYNPGSNSLGGCNYKDSVYPEGLPDYVANACREGNYCDKSGGPNCTPTTEEDQRRYGLASYNKLLATRKEIWGIDNTNCDKTANGQCIIYNQSDDRWKGDTLLRTTNDNTLSTAGCALTSVAIAMTCSGKVTDPNNFNPGVLNAALTPYAVNGDFDWSNKTWLNIINTYAPGFTYVSSQSVAASTTDAVINNIESLKTPTNQVILFLQNAQHKSHYVVYSSADKQTGKVSVMDPGGGVMNTYTATDFKRAIIYE